jgi:agmatinase
VIDLPKGTLDTPGRFLAAEGPEGYAACRNVLVGLPMDTTTSFRPGARFGPGGVREASWGLETYSPDCDAEFGPDDLCDLGDVSLPFGNVAEQLHRSRAVADRVTEDGKRLVGLGGEHLATLPLVEAVLARHPDLVVVHFDAHTDLRDTYLGEKLSHATVLRRVAERVSPERLWQFGIRSGTPEEFRYARHLWSDFARLAAALAEIGSLPIYLTVDIDVVDPAFAPGTGAPEPGGPDSRTVLDAVRAVARRNVVAFDVMEVAPGLDPSGRTAAVAAKIVREVLLAARGTGADSDVG